MSLVKLILLGILLSSLLACGYQLRGLQGGNFELAVSSVAITGSRQDRDLLRLLSQRLEQSGVTEQVDAGSAEVELRIDRVTQSRRVLSVNASSKVSEFELHYAVDYVLKPTDGQEVRRSASSRRDITFDEDQVLAKAEEESRLYDEMRGDVVNTMLRVLQRTTAVAQ